MASSSYPPLKTSSAIFQDVEVELIDRLTVAATQAGVRIERIDVARIFVALKPRPMAILAGPLAAENVLSLSV